MKISEYGEGGYDPTKENDNIVSQYDIPDAPSEDYYPHEVTIPLSSVDTLQATLEDPATNSIAKIKTALTEFLEELRG